MLAYLCGRGIENFKVDFCGMRMAFAEYGHILLQHEAIHHGQWSLYAALGGFKRLVKEIL